MLLGGFVFFIGGHPQRGIPVGVQRLLTVLAISGRLMTRQRVAGTLWPDSSDGHAFASLRSAVSRLEAPVRQALTVTAQDLSLHEDVVVDVHQSEALARRLINGDSSSGALDIDPPAILSLSNDLLPGWYDDWALGAADDWHQLRVHALEAAAARLTAANRLAEAAGAAHAAARAEPLRESARIAVMRVHMAEGNQAEALAEFERYSRLLRQELGLAPTARMREVLVGLEMR
jgi:DNA-binding SARP family transcriptional activator